MDSFKVCCVKSTGLPVNVPFGMCKAEVSRPVFTRLPDTYAIQFVITTEDCARNKLLLIHLA